MQKVLGLAIVACVLLPLSAAIFLVVSILVFIQSLPSADLVEAATDHFVGRQDHRLAPRLLREKWREEDPSIALEPYESQVQAASARYGLNTRLVKAVIIQESGGDPRATSPAGAAGLMQLMPATFAGLGYDPDRIYEPSLNIEAGVRYLAHGLTAFDGDVYWAVAAYNAGIAGASRLKDKHGYVPATFAGGETRRYVEAVLALMGGK